MKNAKIIVARYKSGLMTKEQILNYINAKYHQELDKKVIDYIKSNL